MNSVTYAIQYVRKTNIWYYVVVNLLQIIDSMNMGDMLQKERPGRSRAVPMAPN